ncbi:hypothetical protein ACIBG8_26920 [Nonomuraea sp. NPDC050556]|uniref:hypothetical protein n=1 Tax=Nonomuraea sp. NPDC050556 TaxID=3364369 RepID=UPI0037B93A26
MADRSGEQDPRAAASGVTSAGPSGARPSARKKLLLRLDPAVHDAIAKWAADDLRSVNAQIEYALRMALKQAGRNPGAATDKGPKS